MMRKTIAVVALTALLAACDSGADDAADGRTAEGEVLGGTISDAMLPLDTVKSQSPPLRTEPAGDAEGDDASADEAAEAPADEPAAEEAEAEPEPAVPTPEISIGSEDGE
jgi:hypothetical protein